MNKKELTLLYNRVTAMACDIEDVTSTVDENELIRLLEEVSIALKGITEEGNK